MFNKKRSITIIYTAIIAILAICSVSVSVNAYFLHSFSYQSYYPMHYGWSSALAKEDSSNAAVYYEVGPNGYDLNVQLWGSDGSSADAYNFTSGVSTVVIERGQLIEIPNTAYQYYNGGKCNVSLKMWIYYNGTVSGKWSPTTN